MERELKEVQKWMASIFQEQAQSFSLCYGKWHHFMRILEKSSSKWFLSYYIINVQVHGLES